MLVELRIESLGVIEAATLVFGQGLTALTGETGAGKTMLVEALELLIGGRADPTMVRHGEVEARVEGRFIDGDDEIVLARVVPVEGRSRAYVNGRLATVATLAETGERLVELHGQHAHQSLVTTSAQRAALDRFCHTDHEPLRQARATLAEIHAAIAALGGDSRTRAREIDLLRFQVGELRSAELTDVDEDRILSEREDVLGDALAHSQAAGSAVEILMSEGGAMDLTSAAARALVGRQPFASLHDRLLAATVEIGDLAQEIRHIGEQIEDDPGQLDMLRVRRHLLRDLRRKYGETLEEVLRFQGEAEQRLQEIEQYDQRLAELELERSAASADERRAAERVAVQRRAGAAGLAKAVQTQLRQLALPDAVVEIQVAGEAPCDDITFLLKANPGGLALPLSKVASGGELARAMLALRLVLTDAPDTMIFDEVDAGIGGSAAISVGQSLANLASARQVLVVTHLAQVASQASQHVVVEKHSTTRSTTATVREVHGDDRIDEVARMLSGDAASPLARDHAAELVDRGRVGRR